MRNINSPNEYHAYKNTSGDSNNGGGAGRGPSGSGWIIIGIVVFFLLSFIFSRASWKAIETLLALGFIAYLIFK